MPNDAAPGVRSAGAELVIPVAGFAYAIYYVWSVWDFPLQAQISGMMLAGLLVVLSLIFFARTATALASGRARMDFSPLLGPKEGRSGRIVFVLLTLAYVPVVPYGGFVLTTFVFVLAASTAVGLRPISKAALFAAAAALGGWLFFIVILRTRFPPGPFEKLMQPLLSSIGI